jgi:hypothetical protein
MLWGSPSGWTDNQLTSAVLHGWGMPKLAKQRENLLLINGSHQYPGRDRPKP